MVARRGPVGGGRRVALADGGQGVAVRGLEPLGEVVVLCGGEYALGRGLARQGGLLLLERISAAGREEASHSQGEG